MTDQPYTEDDVRRYAPEVAKTRTDCDPSAPCASCVTTTRAMLGALAAAGRLLPADAPIEWAIRLTWPNQEPSYVRHYLSRETAERDLGKYADWECDADVVWRSDPRPGPWVAVPEEER